MQWSDISFTPTSRKLRQFAGLWLLSFAVLAAVQLFLRHNSGLACVLAILAVAIALPGFVKPGAIRPVYVGSMIVAFPIGWTVSKIILACLFYGVFTTVALIFRLMGRDALGRRRRLATETYWTPKRMATDPHSYFRQF